MIARLFVEHAVHFAHPAIDDRVGRHSPVATWREADAAHLWSVGQAAALELLREEAPEERVQPVVDKLAGVLALEGVHGQHEDLLGAEAEAEEIVEEEVVELIGTHQVFRLLCDVALVVGRRQFGRDRCVDDIVEHLVGRASVLGKLLGGLVGVGHEGHEVADERLGNADVDSIHAHVVAIVGTPSEGQFAEVARADDQSAILVAQVHEDLRAFACLRVFVGCIVDGGVVADVGKMLCDGLGNADLMDRDA